MKTTIKEITPQWAAQILETRNPNNRNLSDRIVEKFARDITNNDWCLTHQGIAFDSNGDLLDGQHRLAAVVKAKLPVKMLVTTGLPVSFKNNGHTTTTFSCIDAGKPRNPSINLELLNYKNVSNVASTARAVAMLCTGNPRVMLSAACVERVVVAMTPSIERCVELSTSKKIIRLYASPLAAISFYHTTHPQQAEEFLIETQNVSGGKGAATRALSGWIARHPRTGNPAAYDTICVTSSAIYHWSRATSVEKLYGSEDAVRWLRQTNQPLKKQIESLLS